MINRLHKFGLIAVGSALLAGWEANPAQAALFEFYTEYPDAEGELYFPDSNLTGVGRKTTTLNELNDYYQDSGSNEEPPRFYFDFEYVPPFGDASGENLSYDGNAEFTFRSGELVGITKENASRTNVITAEGNFGFYSVFMGDLVLSLLGDRYEVLITGETTEYELTDDYLSDEPVYAQTTYPEEFIPDAGEIFFETIEPATSAEEIPEPLSILGSATALGFGIYFKRKLKKAKFSSHH